MQVKINILLLATWMLAASFSFPDEKKFLSRKAVDIMVYDASGKPIPLFSLLRNKPLILCPVYTRCPSICGILSNGVQQSINKLGTLGKDFNVVSFSFDSSDSPVDLKNYEERWKMDGNNWKTISATPVEINRLLKSVDFQYDYVPTTREFDHPPVLIILTPSGRISRYIYGINPSKKDIRIAVMKAAAEKSAPGLLKGLYLRCFAYDPITKTYRLDWGFIISTGAGLLIIGIICTIFFRSFITRSE